MRMRPGFCEGRIKVEYIFLALCVFTPVVECEVAACACVAVEIPASFGLDERRDVRAQVAGPLARVFQTFHFSFMLSHWCRRIALALSGRER